MDILHDLSLAAAFAGSDSQRDRTASAGITRSVCLFDTTVPADPVVTSEWRWMYLL
jgi:hypothetical protein